METTSSQRRQFSSVVSDLSRLLEQSHLTMATAESCTGGTIASMITSRAGSSAWFKGGVVSYAVEVKEQVLGVDVTPGVVSESVAWQMACQAARLMHADCAVATTGVAGPGGGTPTVPVGTVCIAACFGDAVQAQTFLFHGDRETVILQAADAALQMLAQIITARK